MLNHNISCLLKLCNIAFIGVNRGDSFDGIDWNHVFEVSKKQGVSAIVLDALDKCPKEQRPPQSIILKWIGQAVMQERMYARYVNSISSLAEFYKRHGIRMLLLKGYGCGLCYPRPEHRPSGDIDIFLFGKKDEADDLLEKELGINVDREYHKHSNFYYNSVEVENHAKFVDDLTHKSNIRFEKTLASALEKYGAMPSPIDNVLLPSPTFNALFLLRHTGEHFASNEITLRHVLDVGTFFCRYHEDIDWPCFHKVYEHERMTRFFNAIATICVECLGMSATCFASADGKYSYYADHSLAERIISDIFDERKALPASTEGINTIGKKLKYSVEKSLRWWHNRWKFRLVYDESLAESFWWLARNRIKDIINR